MSGRPGFDDEDDDGDDDGAQKVQLREDSITLDQVCLLLILDVILLIFS